MGIAVTERTTGPVSVVIPTYNRAHCIADTLRSVISQTISPQEVIVVDDGSSDDTAGAVAPYAPKVAYIRKSNGGVSSARNVGVRAATAEYVAFLDADDVWLPAKLETQLAVHAAVPEAAWSVVNHVTTDLASRPLSGPQGFARDFPAFRERGLGAEAYFAQVLDALTVEAAGAAHRVYRGDVYRLLFGGNFVFPSGVMVRRDLFARAGAFDETLRVAEDTEFFHRLARYGAVAVIMTPLFYWRRGRPGTLLTGAHTRSLIRNALLSIDRALALADSPDIELRGLHAAARGRLLRRLAWSELTDFRGAEARRVLAEARGWGVLWSPRDVALWLASWLPPALLAAAADHKRRRRAARERTE